MGNLATMLETQWELGGSDSALLAGDPSTDNALRTVRAIPLKHKIAVDDNYGTIGSR